MKKILLLLSFVATLASCGGDVYTITGSVDGAIDGDSVILGYSINGTDFTTTDKAVIEQGRFQFTGKVEGPKIYYLGYEQAPEPLYILFFLEGGDIKADISASSSKVTGTPANDLNVKIENELSNYIDKLYQFETQLYSDTLMSDSAKSAISLKAMETQRDGILYIKDAIRNNINSIVGMYLLVMYNDHFDKDEFTSLVNEIPKSYIDRDNNSLYDILQEMLSNRRMSHKIDEIIGSDTTNSKQE